MKNFVNIVSLIRVLHLSEGLNNEDSECPVCNDSCNKLYRPVLCGASECYYFNPCEAVCAGFSPEDDKSEMSSACEFEEIDEIQETNVTTTTSHEIEANNLSSECPVCNDACNKLFRPVLCGELECYYSNPCEAACAGFFQEKNKTQMSSECILKNEEEEIGETEEPTTIESPDSTTDNPSSDCPSCNEFCDQLFRPVLCGASECYYTNPCEAICAGFFQEDNITEISSACVFTDKEDPLNVPTEKTDSTDILLTTQKASDQLSTPSLTPTILLDSIPIESGAASSRFTNIFVVTVLTGALFAIA